MASGGDEVSAVVARPDPREARAVHLLRQEDTLDAELYVSGLATHEGDTRANHDICAVSGGTMAYISPGSTQCAVITELDRDGTTRPIFDSAPVTGTACHGNAIRYSKKQDLYVFSDRQTDVFVIDRSGQAKGDLEVGKLRSAAAMAAEAQLSLRTVRRALAKAVAAGYLALDRRGSGRGKPTVYRLTLPSARLRHDGIKPTLPRRQASAISGRFRS